MLRLLAIAASVTFCGCASRLVVTGEKNRTLSGVPVRAPLLAEVTREISYTPLPTAGEHAVVCAAKERITTLEVLPLGRVYHVGFRAASMGKSEFKLDLGESGTLKSVSLNSDPKAPEALKEVGALLGTVLPFVAEKQEAAVALTLEAANANALRDKHCMRTATRVVDVVAARVKDPPPP